MTTIYQGSACIFYAAAGTIGIFCYLASCEKSNLWREKFAGVVKKWAINLRIPAWIFIYCLVGCLLVMLVIDAAASRNDPIKALPTFYKSVAIVLNIFLTYPFYKLLLKHIDNLSPSASKTEGAKNHGRSICLVSTHLAFAYVSALGSFAWFALYVLIIGVGFKEWPGWHAVLIMLYVAASVSLLVFALWDINRLVQFEKYRTYVEHYEPHGDSNGSGGILLPGVWPDTINNPLSWFRIGLAVLSVAAALV